ncbi:MAG: hypothetical protein JWM19_3092 [Actinomycetia bacterium]|nr:hypothetical protein [Actinomycetes bacterium]
MTDQVVAFPEGPGPGLPGCGAEQVGEGGDLQGQRVPQPRVIQGGPARRQLRGHDVPRLPRGRSGRGSGRAGQLGGYFPVILPIWAMDVGFQLLLAG